MGGKGINYRAKYDSTKVELGKAVSLSVLLGEEKFIGSWMTAPHPPEQKHKLKQSLPVMDDNFPRDAKMDPPTTSILYIWHILQRFPRLGLHAAGLEEVQKGVAATLPKGPVTIPLPPSMRDINRLRPEDLLGDHSLPVNIGCGSQRTAFHSRGMCTFTYSGCLCTVAIVYNVAQKISIISGGILAFATSGLTEHTEVLVLV